MILNGFTVYAMDPETDWANKTYVLPTFHGESCVEVAAENNTSFFYSGTGFNPNDFDTHATLNQFSYADHIAQGKELCMVTRRGQAIINNLVFDTEYDYENNVLRGKTSHSTRVNNQNYDSALAFDHGAIINSHCDFSLATQTMHLTLHCDYTDDQCKDKVNAWGCSESHQDYNHEEILSPVNVKDLPLGVSRVVITK